MKQKISYFLVVLAFVSSNGLAAPFLDKNSYWQCFTEDNAQRQWFAKSGYKKVALNMALTSCKKESQTPATCKSSLANCEGFYQGMSTKPKWKCTAIDKAAASWESNFYAQRDDAALGAKAYCKQKSSVPDTCYINMITCMNYNEGVKM